MATNRLGTATSAAAALTVNPATPVIVWAAPGEIMAGAALTEAQLNAVANVPGTFVYTPGTGTVMETGMHTLGVTFTPADPVNYTTATATQTLLVGVVPAAPAARPAGDILAGGFVARWNAVPGAAGYYLDVATNSAFSAFVPGYQGRDVGDVTEVEIAGLAPATTYYYRVTAYDATGAGADSRPIAVITPPAPSTAAPLTVSTLAGQPLTPGGGDGACSSARFHSPAAVATDVAGNVFVADTDNHTIRKITPSGGTVVTIAGAAGVAGDADGAGSTARFNSPSGLAVDTAGNVYVADTLNNTLRMVTAAGVVSTIAGTAGAGGAVDAFGSAARFCGPQALVVDGAGNLYVADTNNGVIRKVVLATGEVTTIAGMAGSAGSADGAGTGARFDGPSGITRDSAGNLYVADTGNHSIRAITPGGTVSTLAGMAGNSGGADGTGSAATFDGPSAVAVDGSGNVYVADTGNFTLRKVAMATGVTGTVAGLAGTSGSADGTGSAARFFLPVGVAVDNSGNVYVADTNNNTIRLGTLPAAPTIQTQPQSQTVTSGGAVQFSVTATGRPAPVYQWSHGGIAITGATASSFNLVNVQPADAGSYTVAVSNSAGSVTSSAATLTVRVAATPSSSGGGGGGAPSLWFGGALLLLTAVRRLQRRLGR